MKCPDCGELVPTKKGFTPQSKQSAKCKNCGKELDPRRQPHKLSK